MPEIPPNIVLILVDDADAKVIEHEICDPIRERISDVGATATRYLASAAICAPSRATILRGLYPQNTGVVGNTDAYCLFKQNGGETSNVGVWFQEAEYTTAMLGKYLNGYEVPEDDPMGTLATPPGWDYWFGIGNAAYEMVNYTANDNGTWREYFDDEADYLTDVLAAKTLAFLDSVADDPFLLIVTPTAPHAPARPADRHLLLFEPGGVEYPRQSVNPSFNEDDVSDKPWYIKNLAKFNSGQRALIDARFTDRLRCMAAVADLVEDVIEKLGEVTDRLENTYVFFTSDHGFHMGEHRLGRDELQDLVAQAPGGKNSMYEEDIRVPLYVRGPLVSATSVDQLLGNVDLAPTFCDIAGIVRDTDTIDGRSFLPLLEGTEEYPWRNKYLITRGENKPYAGIRMANETVFAEFTTPPALGEPPGEFYDLNSDAPELENGYLGLSNTLLGALQTQVAAYASCSGDGCRTADSST